MKILIVCSGNSGKVAPFINEQAESIRIQGFEIDFFLIRGKGIVGYYKNLKYFKKELNIKGIQLIHAHYGLSGLLANLQRKIPVITTFHGSDINDKRVRVLSRFAMRLSVYNIFISEKLARLAYAGKNSAVIPCGVDFNTFYPMDKSDARKKLNLELDEKIVLFSGSFDNKVKNSALALDAVNLIGRKIRLIELRGYSRDEVNLLLNACNVALMTSFSEGSPQFIKEAMACNCPIVSTDVGDIWKITSEVEGTFICDFSITDVAEKLLKAISLKTRTNGRSKIKHLEINTVAKSIITLYHQFVSRN